jgi:hypothetical protein
LSLPIALDRVSFLPIDNEVLLKLAILSPITFKQIQSLSTAICFSHFPAIIDDVTVFNPLLSIHERNSIENDTTIIIEG